MNSSPVNVDDFEATQPANEQKEMNTIQQHKNMPMMQKLPLSTTAPQEHDSETKLVKNLTQNLLPHSNLCKLKLFITQFGEESDSSEKELKDCYAKASHAHVYSTPA